MPHGVTGAGSSLQGRRHELFHDLAAGVAARLMLDSHTGYWEHEFGCPSSSSAPRMVAASESSCISTLDDWVVQLFRISLAPSMGIHLAAAFTIDPFTELRSAPCYYQKPHRQLNS